jgi:ketosteroid isomerase-like protein
MSQENVELVLRLMPDPEADVAAMVRDDEQWELAAAALHEALHPDFEFITRGAPRDETPYPGVDGLRRGFLDWFGPWSSYRVETERAIDRGEQVVLLNVEYGRMEAHAPEVKVYAASVWTIREGRIIRMETGPRDRHADALKGVGREE